MGEPEQIKRLRNHRRVLRVVATLVSLAALFGCIDRMHANIGVWGVFVWWAVAGIVALAWPLAFLVTGFRATSRQQVAVFATALGLTLSSIALLPIGWGLVMVLNPEYAVGWYLPARRGGSEIRDVAHAMDTGRGLITFATPTLLGIMASMVALTHHVSGAADPEKSKSKSRRKSKPKPKPRPKSEPVSATEGLGWAAFWLWGFGALFWLVALGLGLIGWIQSDRVARKLAECASGSGSCQTDAWVAHGFSSTLVAASVVALLLPAVIPRIVRGTWSPIMVEWADDRPALALATGLPYHAGSLVALASGILYARWADSTCTGRNSSRSCGVADPDFSFAAEWPHWVTVWALLFYAALAYLVVFGLLAANRSDLALLEVSDRAAAKSADAAIPGSSVPHVLAYLVSLALLVGAGWSALSLWQHTSTPAEIAGSWEEFVAENMNTSAHPHLEEVTFEIPLRDEGLPVLARIVLTGAGQEMPAAEATSLIDTACTYRASRWRASGPETWVQVAYGAGRDKTRFAQFGCETNHRQAAGSLMAWMEEHPSTARVDEISIKPGEDGALETRLHLPDDSTTSFRGALTHLCSFPATPDVARSATISNADREVNDIDCADADAVVATWEANEQASG